MPGSSSTVTVSSSTSGASGIVASETWLPGLCSWVRGVGVGGRTQCSPCPRVQVGAGLDARNDFLPTLRTH